MDHYEVLGVSKTAPQSVIRAAYKARMRESHPDAGGSADDAQHVNAAFYVLDDPARRASYDAERQRGAEAEETVPPHLVRTAQTSSQEAEPVVYRGDIDPPKRWWKAPSLAVFAVLTSAASVAALVTSAGALDTWLVVCVTLISVCVAVRGGPWKVPVVGFVIGLAVAWFCGPAASYAVLTALLGAGTAIAARWAIRREILGWETYAGDVVLTTVNEQTGVELYRVEFAQGQAERMDVLLMHVETGRQQSQPLWGRVEEGAYIALADGSDIPLCQATSAGVSRAIVLRA